MLLVQRKVFLIQCGHRDKLVENLESKFPDEVLKYTGFENKIENLYDKFGPEEKKLHGLIRGNTKNSLLPLNKNIQTLAREIKTELFKIKPDEKKALREQLETLDLHITLWLAKYEDWIPGNPQNALVYMADEEMHGIGFPKGIEKLISGILTELQLSQNKMIF